MLRASVGYGPLALDALEEAVAGLKESDPMAPVVVIVPSDIVGIAVRRRLARGVGDRTGIAALTVRGWRSLSWPVVWGAVVRRHQR